MHFYKDRITNYAIPPDPSVPLARLFGTRFNLDKKTSATKISSDFLTIHKNDDALAWRVALIEQAQHSIDAQYYSWRTDISGQWLLSKLIEAADRGVRIRLLLDDIHSHVADRRIATLNRHNNIEVRIFNPFLRRWRVRFFRVFELLWNLDRLNHRMHNKVIIADNVASIIGGRNIADEFFGLHANFVFRDIDVLISGTEVEKLSYSFDLFWNSTLSKTARRLIAFRPGKFDFHLMMKRLNKNIISSRSIIERINNIKTTLLTDPNLHNKLIKAEATVFYDLPSDHEIAEQHMAHDIYQYNLQTKKQLTIISPYFIPSEKMIASLQSILDKGVKIQVLTNSLASIDVTAAFTGYERYRHQLLSMGIELFEFRAEPENHTTYSTSTVNVDYISLHAKSIIYDDDAVYIGSLNLDPRSENLNTEIGLFIKNSELVKSVYRVFMEDIRLGKYWHVKYNDQGRLIWQCQGETIKQQPARHLWQRLIKVIYSLLPIQQHL